VTEERSKTVLNPNRSTGRCLALASVLLLSSCSRSSHEDALSSLPPLPEGSPNVILVSIDTLRADHLGSYGYPRATSPRIDAFAASSIRFENGWSSAPWTLPGHAEMLTGRHPHDIGVIHKRSAIPDSAPLLAEILSAGGYDTAAFVDSSKGGLVGAERGFARGFRTYQHAPHRKGLAFEYDAAVTVQMGLEWLRTERSRSKPFFLFLHTKSVHSVQTGTPRPDQRTPPYDVPRGDRFQFLTEEQARLAWNSPELGEGTKYLNAHNEAYQNGVMDPRAFPTDQREALIGLYDASIRYTDEQFGVLLDALDAEGLLARTLIVLTADHGEEFLDHGRFLHEQVYRELLHVPLIVKLPDSSGGRVVQEDVSLADIVPTVLDYLGVSPSIAFAGRSLLEVGPGSEERPLLASFHEVLPDEKRPRYYGLCRTLSRQFEVAPNWLSGCLWAARRYSLRRGPWTLVYHEFLDGRKPTTELYDNHTDPAQKRPSHDEETASVLFSELADRREMAAGQGARSIAVDEETQKQLEALGYVRE
jgi:arylsulfatase A-like enzyme